MIKLTQTVQKGGCAAKVAAHELRKVLGGVRFPAAPPELLVDGRHFDDASVQKLTSDLALVSTLDFFTPIVDTPRVFGAIAAANAISDVYAMGGRPLTALGILAYPVAQFDSALVGEVLQGACDVLSEARATLSGGHSIDDDTLKFGLSVSGVVHPDRIWANTGARAGDVLILTKALGTGTLTAALKRQTASEEDIAAALASMTQLNNAIDYLEPAGLATSVHAATDITGFGLAGHALQMARASGVDFAIEYSAIPKLPRALEMIAGGFLTKAHRTNKEYTANGLQFDPANADLSEPERQLLFDPQTSGGLLLSISADQADAALAAVRTKFKVAAKIGTVRPRAGQESALWIQT